MHLVGCCVKSRHTAVHTRLWQPPQYGARVPEVEPRPSDRRERCLRRVLGHSTPRFTLSRPPTRQTHGRRLLAGRSGPGERPSEQAVNPQGPRASPRPPSPTSASRSCGLTGAAVSPSALRYTPGRVPLRSLPTDPLGCPAQGPSSLRRRGMIPRFPSAAPCQLQGPLGTRSAHSPAPSRARASRVRADCRAGRAYLASGVRRGSRAWPPNPFSRERRGRRGPVESRTDAPVGIFVPPPRSANPLQSVSARPAPALAGCGCPCHRGCPRPEAHSSGASRSNLRSILGSLRRH